MVTYLNTPQIFGSLSCEQNISRHLWKSQDQRTQRVVLLHLLESGGGFFTGEVLFIAVGAKAMHSALLRPGAAQVREPMLQPVHTFVYVCFPSVNMDAYFLGKCSSAFPVLLVLYY